MRLLQKGAPGTPAGVAQRAGPSIHTASILRMEFNKAFHRPPASCSVSRARAEGGCPSPSRAGRTRMLQSLLSRARWRWMHELLARGLDMDAPAPRAPVALARGLGGHAQAYRTLGSDRVIPAGGDDQAARRATRATAATAAAPRRARTNGGARATATRRPAGKPPRAHGARPPERALALPPLAEGAPVGEHAERSDGRGPGVDGRARPSLRF
jgi:hypothetical protein